MRVADHYFEAMPWSEVNGNGTRTCRHCKRVPEVHPPSPHLPRDIEHEREIRDEAIDLAPHLAGLDYKELLAYAEQRMLDGPIRNARKRNWPNEGEQELADALNYWTEEIKELERLEAEDGEDRSMERLAWLHVIIKTCELWDRVQAAKSISRRI